ncbi:hypothetical protein NQ318_000574 [Aromia moschata]|uniref:Uncharacterized protein n=1 Tax=Aromia moschata TaxID=1265417 RepID=A0AAV8XA31_9CUCU|nr:hypothetical protein NQ318_000574 [Aromia moschata]
MLMLGKNPHTSSRQTPSALNISHSSILRVFTENQMHPYTLRCSKIMYRRWQACIQLKQTHNFQVMQYGSSRMAPASHLSCSICRIRQQQQYMAFVYFKVLLAILANILETIKCPSMAFDDGRCTDIRCRSGYDQANISRLPSNSQTILLKQLRAL